MSEAGLYWLGAEFGPNPVSAWAFDDFTGYQYAGDKTTSNYLAWAVRSGARTVGGGATPVGYNPAWLIITLASLMIAGGFLLRRRMVKH